MVLALKKMKQFQVKRKLNQKQLAVFLEISYQYVSMLYNGHRTTISDSLKSQIEIKTEGYVKFADWGKDANNKRGV